MALIYKLDTINRGSITMCAVYGDAIMYLCPLKTSCDSSMIFHTRRVRSLAPAVTGLSLLKQFISTTES